jgi:aspartyl-tRNA(Asn)/glutamyl-tRNA(Gln) amidotransferase subunit A
MSRPVTTAPWPSRNPWNLDFVTGGSSSGLQQRLPVNRVAALVPTLAVRCGFRHCGVTAWKPTFGIVSVSGALLLRRALT